MGGSFLECASALALCGGGGGVAGTRPRCGDPLSPPRRSAPAKAPEHWRTPKTSRPSRSASLLGPKLQLGTALAGEVALRADGVSAGGAGTDSHPQTPPPREVQLRSQARAEAGASAREEKVRPHFFQRRLPRR